MRFVRSAAALLLAGAALAVSAQTKWDLPAGYPAGNPHTQNLNQFAADVAKATGGKLAITVHPGGALFKAPEIKRAVQTGQAQIGEVLMSLLENENPVFGADSVPFVATGFDASFKLWQAQKPIAEKILAAQGIKLLYAVAWPPQGIYSKKQLNSTADMKGLKWRAYNPATTRIAQLVGAQPLTIQAAELSQALATGVVDSFMSSGATGVDSKVWESLTHFATVDAWLPKNMVIINQKEFDKLDKPTQDAVLAAALRHGDHIRVTLLIQRLTGRRRWWIEVFCLAVATFLSGYFAWFAGRLVWGSYVYHDVSQNVDATPLWIPQLSMAVGLAAMFLAFLEELIETLRTGKVVTPAQSSQIE